MEQIILDPTNMSMMPILEDFLDRHRRTKYDHYNGKLYHVIWTPEALRMRKDRQLELRRQKYREEHPEKPKPELSAYLRKKQERISKLYGGECGLRMESSQTVGSI
jgi:hypothetical protein